MALPHVSIARPFLLTGFLAALAGCAATPLGPTVAVMPGPGKSFEAFRADNDTCKFFAADSVKGQADAANQRAAGAALLGTVLGAGLGAATGSAWGNAGGGAGIGAAAGLGTGVAAGASTNAYDQANIQQQYDVAFSQCMYSKGEQVPGFAPVVAMTDQPPPSPAAAVAPDPLVRATQAELIRLGYLHGGADGVMGGRTRAAIAAYESANGMPPDGAPSRSLLSRLQSTPGSPPPTTVASAPSHWVAPAGTPPASAPPNWVAPTSGPDTAPAAQAPSGWVAPVK